MVNIVKSFSYPFASKENLLNSVLFLIFTTAWYLLFPVILFNGYLVKMIRNVMQGKKEMPFWPVLDLAGWGYIIKHGFLYTVIMAVYLAVPFLFAFLGTYNGISLYLILVSVVLFLAVIFIMPMALAYYAATENFLQAFNIPEIGFAIFRHISSYALVFFITAIMFLLAIFLGSYVSLFLGAFMAYPIIFEMHAFAQILAEEQ